MFDNRVTVSTLGLCVSAESPKPLVKVLLENFPLFLQILLQSYRGVGFAAELVQVRFRLRLTMQLQLVVD